MNEFELQTQRLIDGQLSREQIQDLLKQADHDDSWRDIAAAFVEDQIWQGEINSVFADNTKANSTAAGSAPNSPANSKPDSRAVPGVKFWLALAAAVLAGIWLGRVWSPQELDNTSPNNAVVSNPPEDSLPDNNAVQVPQTRLVENLQPAHRLSMGEAGDVPLYTLAQAEKMGLLKQPSVPQETIDRFRKQGYQLEQSTRYISGEAQDGRKILVPIRSVRVDPGN